MKRIITAFASIMMVALASSCNQESNYLYYSMTDICEWENGNIVNDKGTRFYIVENKVPTIKIDTMKRFLLVFDVLKNEARTGQEYDIEVTDAARVDVRDILVKSECNMDELGTDGITLSSAWISKGYLNALGTYTMETNSTKAHRIEFVYNDTKSNSDTLYFNLTHNAYGDSYDNKDKDASSLTKASEYVSFPISKYIEKLTKPIVISINWSWFITGNDGYLKREKEDVHGEMTYDPAA